jgi:N-acetylglucosamine-6-phosphate deacetylase
LLPWRGGLDGAFDVRLALRREAGMNRIESAQMRRRRFMAGSVGGVSALVLPGMRALSSEASSDRQMDPAGPRTVELPGFVDLQVNGFTGVDFGDPTTPADRILEAIAAIEKTGVTRFLPTLITSSLQDFQACAKTLVRTKHAAIVGIHMEGPYISPEDGPRGAHLREFVREATIEDFERRQEAAEGRILLVTIAPEARGTLRLVEHLAGQGVRVAIGHTGASPAQIADAVRAGATLSTHLGNGCAQLLLRHPNVIWEQLAEDRLLASFIVDGHHLPPATVKAMVRAKTPARTILVTDAIAAAGMPPGVYHLARQQVELSPSGRVAVPGAPNLAGSALRVDVAIGNTARFTGLPLEEVVPMASKNPAGYLGIAAAGKVLAEWDAASCRLRILRVET